MSYGGSSGGGGKISTSADAALSNVTNGDVLAYDATTQKWKNLPAASGIADGSLTPAKVSGLTAGLAAKLGTPLVITTSATIPPGTAPTFVIRS